MITFNADTGSTIRYAAVAAAEMKLDAKTAAHTSLRISFPPEDLLTDIKHSVPAVRPNIRHRRDVDHHDDLPHADGACGDLYRIDTNSIRIGPTRLYERYA